MKETYYEDDPQCKTLFIERMKTSFAEVGSLKDNLTDHRKPFMKENL